VLNDRLRQLRRSRRLTQEQLAELVCDYVEAATGHRPGVTSVTVSKLERGEVTWPNKDTRAALRAIFNVEQDDELGLYSRRSSENWASDTQQPSPTSEVKRLQSEEDDDVQRRDFLRTTIGTSGLSLNVPTLLTRGSDHHSVANQLFGEASATNMAHESALLGQRIAMTNVRPETLEQIDADIERIGRAYLSRPLTDVVAETRYVRNVVFDVLEGRQSPNQARHLHVQAAQLCGVLASASSDLGFYDAARTHARTAALCADLADVPSVRSWIAATQSLIEFWDERPMQALQRAQAGQQYATSDVDTLRLYSLEARASARLGDVGNTRAAIGRMIEVMDRAEIGTHRTIFDFPQANALRCAGSSYLWLGEYADAERFLAQALAAFNADSSGGSYAHVAVTRIDLALAQLGNGDFEAAQDTLGPVLEMSPERRLSGTVRRFEDLRAALRKPRYRRVSAAQSLSERLKTLSAVVTG
jgi:transcriptional regulator with XRE-family HTH domain